MTMSEYSQVKVSVNADVASAFKNACRIRGVSMASELSSFMASYSRLVMTSRKSRPLDTRDKRRRAVNRIISDLQRIYDAEDTYLHSIPENLSSGPAFEAAECCLECLSTAMEALAEAF
jgi:hypothetical protein